MLTIKAPIELKCNTALVPSWEAFHHRIVGNYEMMSSGISKEDLLHMVTAPPEVYLAEGSMTSLVQNTQVQNRQETKMEIINNLINRIVVMEDVDLTYQDRVYITDVLKKLGVQNVQQFMSEVNRLKEETQNTEQKIQLYWNYLEEHMQLWEEHHTTQTQTSNTSQQEQQVRINLHETIMNRLQTGAVYQVLDNFYSNYNGNSYYVNEQAFQITEQKRTATKLLLQQLTNEVTGKEEPLVYRHENHYETMQLTEEMLNEEMVNNQVSSAVLLNLVDNLFLNRLEKQISHKESWMRAENVLYQTAENTLWRLQNQVSNQGFWQSNTIYKEQEVQTIKEVEEVTPTATIHSASTFDLMEQLQIINQQNVENYHTYQKMIRNYQKEHKKRKENSSERMRKESLMALSNPQQLLEIYKEEAKEQEKQEAIQVQEMTRLLPEQTRKIYEQIEQYRNQPRQQEMGAITRNNIAMLLQDIQETQNFQINQMEHPSIEQIQKVTEAQFEYGKGTIAEEVEQTPSTQVNKALEQTQQVVKTQKDKEDEPIDLLQTQIPVREIESQTELSEEVFAHWQRNQTHKYDVLEEEKHHQETITLLHKKTEEQIEEEVQEDANTFPTAYQRMEQDLRKLAHSVEHMEFYHTQTKQFSEEQLQQFHDTSQSIIERWKEYLVVSKAKETGTEVGTETELTEQTLQHLISEMEQIENQTQREVSVHQMQKVKALSEEVLEQWQKNRTKEVLLQEKIKEYQTATLLHKKAEDDTLTETEDSFFPTPQIQQEMEKDLRGFVQNIQKMQTETVQLHQFSEEQLQQFHDTSQSIIERWKEYLVVSKAKETGTEVGTETELTEQTLQHLISEMEQIENQTQKEVSVHQVQRVKVLSEEVLEQWQNKRTKELLLQEKAKEYQTATLLHKKAKEDTVTETEDSFFPTPQIQQEMEKDLKGFVQNIQKMQTETVQLHQFSEEQLQQFHDTSQSIIERWKEYLVVSKEKETGTEVGTKTELTEQTLQHLISEMEQIENQTQKEVSVHQVQRVKVLSEEVLEQWQNNRTKEMLLQEKTKEYQTVTLLHKQMQQARDGENEIEGKKQSDFQADVTTQMQKPSEQLHEIVKNEIEHLQITQFSDEDIQYVQEVTNKTIERWKEENQSVLEQKNVPNAERSIELVQREKMQQIEELPQDETQTESELSHSSSERKKGLSDKELKNWQVQQLSQTPSSTPKVMEQQTLLFHTSETIQQEQLQILELSEERTNQIKELSKDVLERWRERETTPSQVQHHAKTTYNNLNFVHKSQENRLEEDVVEQLLEQSQMLRSNTKVTNYIEENQQTTHTTVSKQTQQTLVKENQDLTELIQRSVQKQIGNISDQVYSKLEKRLQNEKKRRGY